MVDEKKSHLAWKRHLCACVYIMNIYNTYMYICATVDKPISKLDFMVGSVSGGRLFWFPPVVSAENETTFVVIMFT